MTFDLLIAEYDFLGRRLREHSASGGEIASRLTWARDSLLAALQSAGGPAPAFRVSDYNPGITEQYHSATSHRYVISRRLLESDVVVCLPKLKTHEKVGVTCGLKGYVGIVGSKDCLAHHRFGGPGVGGDEYPGDSRVRLWLSRFADWVQRFEPSRASRVLQVVDRSIRRILRVFGAVQFGGWYGNDTAWRMALDLARIAQYAGTDGKMYDAPQRRSMMFVDGVVGGEGNGPLAPRPVASGVMLLADNVVLGDELACRLMGFDPRMVPIVREAFGIRRFPLVADVLGTTPVICNGRGKPPGSALPIVSRWVRAAEWLEADMRCKEESRKC